MNTINSALGVEVFDNNCDANNLLGSSNKTTSYVFNVTRGTTANNLPVSASGTLIVLNQYNTHYKQIYVGLDNSGLYYRSKNGGNAWTEWTRLIDMSMFKIYKYSWTQTYGAKTRTNIELSKTTMGVPYQTIIPVGCNTMNGFVQLSVVSQNGSNISLVAHSLSETDSTTQTELLYIKVPYITAW